MIIAELVDLFALGAGFALDNIEKDYKWNVPKQAPAQGQHLLSFHYRP